MKTLLIYPNLPFNNTLPHSIGRVSACLKESGDEVKLFDTTLYKSEKKSGYELKVVSGQIPSVEERGIKNTDMVEDFNKCIDDFQPDRLMITFVDNTKDIGMNLLKSKNKPIYTIAGGVKA